MKNHPVLVLNQNFEPLNICRVRRAIPLIFDGKAEMLENGLGFIHSGRQSFAIPSVIRLGYMVKRPQRHRKLTRKEIYTRDNYICQYCGQENIQLTLDHIIPRHQGGLHTWENVTCACARCNRHKAGRTPEQANMKLLCRAAKPQDNSRFFVPRNYLERMKEWHKYLPKQKAS